MTIVDPEKIVVDPNVVNITINDKPVLARKGEVIIAAADRTDDFIPRFCYHPRMSSVGMCRQCLVEVETPRGPMMVVSCMTPVAEGQIVRTATDTVKKRKKVCSSCCSQIILLIALFAIKAENVRCKIRRSVTGQAKVGSSKKSATTKNQLQSVTSFTLIANVAFCAIDVRDSPMKLQATR